MTQHTPGPWHVQPFSDVTYVDSEMHSGFRTRICSLRGKKDRLANARLISAAPELLESLQKLLTISHGPDCIIENARAAIAKATGIVKASEPDESPVSEDDLKRIGAI